MCWICEQLWVNQGKLVIPFLVQKLAKKNIFWHISLTCSPVYPMGLSVLFYNCIGNKIENLWINQFLNNYLSCFLSAIKLLFFSRKKGIFIYSINRRDLTHQSLLIPLFYVLCVSVIVHSKLNDWLSFV